MDLMLSCCCLEILKNFWTRALHLPFAPCMSYAVFSHVRLFAASWTVAHQAPLSMGFSRQGYWNGLPLPSPGNLPDPGIKPTSRVSCIGRQILYHWATWEAFILHGTHKMWWPDLFLSFLPLHIALPANFLQFSRFVQFLLFEAFSLPICQAFYHSSNFACVSPTLQMVLHSPVWRLPWLFVIVHFSAYHSLVWFISCFNLQVRHVNMTDLVFCTSTKISNARLSDIESSAIFKK